MTAPARPFAHLLKSRAAKKADDDNEEMREDEKDEHAEDEKNPPKDDKEDGKKGKKAKKAKKAEVDEDNEDEKDRHASKKDEEDEDDMDEDDAEENEDRAESEEEKERAEIGGTSPNAKARSRERARCEKIFASKHAAGRVEAACHLAFKTRMTAKEAIGALAALPAAQAPAASTSRLRDAMAAAPNPVHAAMDDGDEGMRSGMSPAAQRIIAAGKKRRGEK